jgi:ArsR family transcriptional regulator
MHTAEINLLKNSAADAARYLKSVANRNRLLILCHLIEGEKSVSGLEKAIGLRQPTLSQQLARLRNGGLVKARRDSKSIYYSITDADIQAVLEVLYRKFCAPKAGRRGRGTATRKAAR